MLQQVPQQSLSRLQVRSKLVKLIYTFTYMKIVTTPNSAASALLQAGRPRLVAKTASALQQKAQTYKSSAPDPMQVWNKNRITPAPSTKNLTDEELKQQYGIHLTSRLGAEGDGKESKWADIDDDEDDWAPDTIEWTDGTRSTLNPADMVPSPAPPTATQTPEPSNERPKLNLQPSKILTSQFSSSVGPNATVLKVGGSAGKQQLHKTPTQQPKGPVEKPPSSASSTAPAAPPAKSPWAPLPPMEKISPVIINPQPAMPPPQRLPSGQGFLPNQTSVIAPSPAKEISADDFNRNWRDSSQAQPRELYMPNSGRYEPVTEGKRRMSKHDGNFRAPAVLQRPNGQSDPHAPAEPSAAFQTHRNSADTARRRASSTLSGGSGQFARRMSMAKSVEGQQVPLEAIQARRDSVGFRPESRDGPPSSLQTPTYQARGPSPSYNFPQVAPSGQPTEDIEAEKARQKVLMKEKVELARKRKQEEEARLEAEKQERIKLKLASLAPLPNQQSKSGETKVQAIAEVVKEAPLPQVQSPPKPPVPQATGAPQQYGMMKVHPMDSVKQSRISPPQEQQPQQPTPKISPVINGIRPTSESQGPQVDQSPRVPKASVVADARSGWNDPRSGTASNLWGPINNNKALGNGTFDQGLAGYAPQELSSRTSSTPQGWVNGRTPINDRSPQPHFANQHMPSLQPLPTVSMPEQTLAANSEIDSGLPISKPAPIGPPHSSRVQQNWQATQNVGGAAQSVTAWNNFHSVATQQERADDERAQRDIAAKREEQLRTGAKQGPSYTFNETWKQVQLGEQAGQRAVTGVSQASVPAAPGFGAIGALPGTRNSRFFPQGADARRTVTHGGFPQERSSSPSPPPAEEYASGHPAFDGDYQRPVIHFPREKPIVKLPQEAVRIQPPPPPVPAQPMSWAARAAQPAPQPRAVSQPVVQNQNWQDRFSSLFAKEGKTPALAVASSSRDPLDVLAANPMAAVSLPPKQEDDYLKDAGKIASKEIGVEEEEDLFEDRETGDLPVVKPPVGPYKSPGPPVRRSFQTAVPASSYSKPAFAFFDLYLGSKDRDYDESTIVVKLYTMTDAIKRTRQHLGHSANRPYSSGSKGRHPLGASNKQNKQKLATMKSRQGLEAQGLQSQRPQANTSRKVSGQTLSAHGGFSSPVISASATQPQSASQKNSGASSPVSNQLPNGTPVARTQRNTSHHSRGGWQGKSKNETTSKAQAQTAH
jgi:hypothetical protein